MKCIRHLKVFVLAPAAVMTMSCAPMAVAPPAASGPPPPAYAVPPPGAAYPVAADQAGPGPREDRHWIRNDEYFVQGGPLVQGWAWVYLAKMKQPPSPGPKGKALFVYVQDGSEDWSEHYQLTRLAVPADLTEQNVLVCYLQNSHDSVNYAPATKEEARGGGPRWFIGRVVDASDVGRGYVTLAAGRKCAIETLRAIVR